MYGIGMCPVTAVTLVTQMLDNGNGDSKFLLGIKDIIEYGHAKHKNLS